MIEKEILKIIKDKLVDIHWLLNSVSCGVYNMGVGTNQKLKKKEYEMIKGYFNECDKNDI